MFLKINNKILLILILLLFKTEILFSATPENFIKDITNKASEILRKNIDKEIKSEELIELAKDSVDIKGIGLYTLGKHKKTIDEKQLNEYEILFKNYFLKSFSSRLAEYTNPEIDVINKDKLNENYTIVNSILKSTDERPEIKIDWRIYTKKPDNPLIRDLIIEGLSLARTQKEEFASVLSTNNDDIEALFKVLKEFSQN